MIALIDIFRLRPVSNELFEGKHRMDLDADYIWRQFLEGISQTGGIATDPLEQQVKMPFARSQCADELAHRLIDHKYVTYHEEQIIGRAAGSHVSALARVWVDCRQVPATGSTNILDAGTGL